MKVVKWMAFDHQVAVIPGSGAPLAGCDPEGKIASISEHSLYSLRASAINVIEGHEVSSGQLQALE